jgi:DNA-binding protein H-NS
VKYRDAAGNTWSGRGLRPRWLNNALAKGKALSDFAV